MPDRPLNPLGGKPLPGSFPAADSATAGASAAQGRTQAPARASEPSSGFLEGFAEVQEARLEEGVFITDLEGMGFDLAEGKLRLELLGQMEVLVYPGIDGDDGWTGAAARLRALGRPGSVEAISGTYAEVRAAVGEWIERFGRLT